MYRCCNIGSLLGWDCNAWPCLRSQISLCRLEYEPHKKKVVLKITNYDI